MRKFRKLLVITLIAVLAITATLPLSLEEAYAATNGVERIYGSDRYETSKKIARIMRRELGSRFETVILAYGESYADALSASYLASVTQAPIVLTKDKLRNDTISFVDSIIKKTGTVYIIGGEEVIGTRMEKSLASKYNVIRLGGDNRYQTNLKVLREGDNLYKEKHGGKNDKKVLVCSGKNYPDALSAGATGHPILLAGSKLFESQRKYVQGRGQSRYYMIGGTKAVPDKVMNALGSYGSTVRFEGKDRYDTAAVVSKKFFANLGITDKAMIVRGDSFPDGLSAAPLAQLRNCPILLYSKDNVAQAWNYEHRNKTKESIVISGGKFIPTAGVKTAKQLSTGWNKLSGRHVYLEKDGRMKNANFVEAGYTIKVTRGGIIANSSVEEVARMEDSASYGTAVVVHIGSQTLDYVVGGQVKLTTPVVTGRRGMSTPTGTYYVRYKTRNATLAGPGYSSFVRYWMAFIGHSYGIHDASWRNQFGGNIYINNGSHGCINIPPSVMPTLYYMVPTGTKVVVKY